MLVTGASGTVGWMLARKLAGQCRVLGAFACHEIVPSGVEGLRLDLKDIDAIGRIVEQAAPDVIVHLAALTNPDECECNPEAAFRINRDAALEIARVARALGARLIFASTDLVFDGKRGNYTEEHEARPLSIYGRSKLEAEEGVLRACPGAFIFRTSLVYGFGSPVSHTFLTTIIEKLELGEPMKVFIDQKRSPILVDDLARAIVAALEKDLAGRYHIAGNEVLTRYEFALLLCKAFRLDERLLVPIKMAEFGYLARRPLDSSLDSTRFCTATGFSPTAIRAALQELAEEYRKAGQAS